MISPSEEHKDVMLHDCSTVAPIDLMFEAFRNSGDLAIKI
jgi:hypothetical protein